MQLPSSAPSTAASCPEPRGTGVASSQKQSPQPRVQPGPSLPGTPSLGPVDTHPLPDAGDAAFPGLARRFAGSPGTWSPWSPSPSPSDFEADYGDIQEAVPPTGRQPAHCESSPSPCWGSPCPPVPMPAQAPRCLLSLGLPVSPLQPRL
eukprot:XP_022272348.1 vegetative cell wall protein gp1-like [Canis lupus familiaris]